MVPTSPGQTSADTTSDEAPIGCAFGAPSSANTVLRDNQLDLSRQGLKPSPALAAAVALLATR